ncbi:MAG: hypothetical protein NTW31_04085 [Bacteroidetes bacterium]|nr:hypothetical protein [Bacteroidota bacterium]
MHNLNGNDLRTELFDINGHTVRHMAPESFSPDEYRIRFLRGNLSSGNYLLVLISDKRVLARKSLTIN